MATVGHTLVGLSIGSLAGDDSRGRSLRYVWPGLMVLMAHLVDLAEWAVLLVAPHYFDRRFVTNSPAVTAGLVAIVWLVMAVVARLRRPWPYVLMALAVFSHLALDHRVVRTVLTDIYDASCERQMPDLYDAVVAEVWLYGLLLVSVGLVQASRQRDCPARGRAAAGVLGALAIFAAVLRSPALWIPAYVAAALHVVLLYRRALTPRWLWSLVPLLPLAALLSVELWAAHLYGQATALRKNKAYAAAASAYQQVLAVPTRSQKLGALVQLSQCRRRLGDYPAAETLLLRALRVSETPDWARCALAGLYSDPGARGDSLFRPAEAARILRHVLEGPGTASVKGYARRKLERLRRRGLIE